MEDYYEYLDSNGVTTLYKLIKDDTVALIDSYSVTINGITTNLDNHVNNTDIHTPISDIESMIDTKVSGLVNSAPETLDTLKELSDALGNDPNFATTVANQIGSKASKDDVYTKEETDTLLDGKADSVHTHVVSDITDFPTIPTKTSELSNDSNFVTSTELHDYATKNDLNSKQDALSEEQLSNIDSIPDKANKSDLSTVATSGSYKDLLDKPVLPEGADLSDYYNKGETDNLLNSKANTSDLAVVAKSGNYNDLNNTPTIPTKVSQLENDTGFINALTDVVYTKSNQTINGIKTFTNTTISNKELHYKDIKNDWSDKSINVWCDAGHVAWFDKTGNRRMHELVGAQNGVWRKACYINENRYFSVDSNRNISFWGGTTFNGSICTYYDIFFKNNNIDLTVTPTNTLYSNFIFRDKNNQNVAYIQYAKRNVEPDVLGLYIHDADKGLHGLQITSNNYVIPVGNNIYNLGSPNNKWAKIYSDDVVHTNGDETIDGIKTFTNILKIAQGTLQVGSDAGYSVTYSWSGNIVSKQPSGTFNISLPKANGTLAIDENLVHTSGNETITGFKSFTEVLDRRNDVTTSTVATATQLVDTNANRCGWIANRMHWAGNYHVHNRHIAYNENSGKEVYIDIISSNNGSGGLFVGGSATNRNLNDVTSATDYTVLATMGWVNNPTTSTNVVHRSGDETIAGNKTFSNKIKGNLQGNADTATSATKASYLDNYSLPGGNKIYLDWSQQVKGYVGLKVDNTVMGGLITTKNIGSQAANSATYATTQATSDNSTKIATTAWVRAYVDSVAGNNTVGSSVSAYWSNSSNVTATGQASAHSSSSTIYPACYSDYINKTPTVGTIYSGAQLYTEYGTSASATGTLQSQGQYVTRITTTQAQVTFRNPISATGKYLCTTANTVKFRAYTAKGSSSAVGASSIVDYTITKSIFIRVE